MNREKMPVSKRAKQFMPFAALHGYYDLVKRKEEKPSEREDMTEERAEKLSEAAEKIKKGDFVKVRYYAVDRYRISEGAVTEIDKTMRYIKIIKTRIPFEDIADIEITEDKK